MSTTKSTLHQYILSNTPGVVYARIVHRIAMTTSSNSGTVPTPLRRILMMSDDGAITFVTDDDSREVRQHVEGTDVLGIVRLHPFSPPPSCYVNVTYGFGFRIEFMSQLDLDDFIYLEQKIKKQISAKKHAKSAEGKAAALLAQTRFEKEQQKHVRNALSSLRLHIRHHYEQREQNLMLREDVRSEIIELERVLLIEFTTIDDMRAKRRMALNRHSTGIELMMMQSEVAKSRSKTVAQAEKSVLSNEKARHWNEKVCEAFDEVAMLEERLKELEKENAELLKLV
eukprot:PhF_6_TR3331/c0_g1_i1/m.4703